MNKLSKEHILRAQRILEQKGWKVDFKELSLIPALNVPDLVQKVQNNVSGVFQIIEAKDIGNMVKLRLMGSNMEVFGLEFEPIPFLKGDMDLEVKIRVTCAKKVNNFLFLTKTNTEFLGGKGVPQLKPVELKEVPREDPGAYKYLLQSNLPLVNNFSTVKVKEYSNLQSNFSIPVDAEQNYSNVEVKIGDLNHLMKNAVIRGKISKKVELIKCQMSVHAVLLVTDDSGSVKILVKEPVLEKLLNLREFLEGNQESIRDFKQKLKNIDNQPLNLLFTNEWNLSF